MQGVDKICDAGEDFVPLRPVYMCALQPTQFQKPMNPKAKTTTGRRFSLAVLTPVLCVADFRAFTNQPLRFYRVQTPP